MHSLKDKFDRPLPPWIEVIEAKAMTHEQLAWRLAFAINADVPSEGQGNEIVQNIVSCFLTAGKACGNIQLN
jgi:hypothetical protein